MILMVVTMTATHAQESLRDDSVPETLTADPPDTPPLAMPDDPRRAVSSSTDSKAPEPPLTSHLFRGPLRLESTDPYFGLGTAWSSELNVETWGVYDSEGVLFGARAFAERVGDEKGLDALLLRRRQTLTAEWITLGAGAGLVGGGAAMMLTATSSGNADRMRTGTTLSIVGCLPLALGVSFLQTELRFGDMVSRRYSQEEADLWISKHNEGLARDRRPTDANTASGSH